MTATEVEVIKMVPIGFVKGGRLQATKDGWGANLCELALDPLRFSPASLSGVEELSHLEVVFYFHLHADETIELGARHPRDRRDWPSVGIFAQRGRMRVNRIGVSICEVVSVSGLSLTVRGLDAVDGTPVLDIKPVWVEYLPRGPVLQPHWSHELMAAYW